MSFAVYSLFTLLCAQGAVVSKNSKAVVLDDDTGRFKVNIKRMSTDPSVLAINTGDWVTVVGKFSKDPDTGLLAVVAHKVCILNVSARLQAFSTTLSVSPKRIATFNLCFK